MADFKRTLKKMRKLIKVLEAAKKLLDGPDNTDTMEGIYFVDKVNYLRLKYYMEDVKFCLEEEKYDYMEE